MTWCSWPLAKRGLEPFVAPVSSNKTLSFPWMRILADFRLSLVLLVSQTPRHPASERRRPDGQTTFRQAAARQGEGVSLSPQFSVVLLFPYGREARVVPNLLVDERKVMCLWSQYIPLSAARGIGSGWLSWRTQNNQA